MPIETKIALLYALLGLVIPTLGMATMDYPKLQKFLRHFMYLWVIGAILGSAYFIIWVL